MLKSVYGNECLSRTQVFQWFKWFKEGRETAEDNPCPGRPSMSTTNDNIEKICKLIREDCSLSIRVLTALRERVRKQRPDLWKAKSWMLHQDNAPAHSALSALLTKHGITVLEHPVYLPDPFKSALKGTIFESVEAVKAKATEFLNQLTDFQHFFQKWKSHMERCMDRQGVYIEEDEVSVVAILRCRLEGKTEALRILSQDQEQLRSERDQFKLMAEQLRERHTALRKKVEAWGPSLVGTYDAQTFMQEQGLAQLLCQFKERNQILQSQVTELSQKLEDANGDIKALREQIARQRVGSVDSNHFPLYEKEQLVEQLEECRKKSIAKSVNRLPANSSVTVQWLPAHVGIPGNELADSLAKAGTLGLPEARESITQLDEKDLLRTIKAQCLQEWSSNAAHDWYRAGGTSTGSVLPREQQSLISRLKSGHLQTMTFQNGCKVFPLCTK
ncbi:hypothetical protein LAZ67_20001717 [Cordylochernes scorpioides]|uniref:RNase H type-1 domain-containing protein n=1 Tax=Cordylochernes scorpioides TaxID=51811 RepID=A0ABY6LKD8_9ARAC|nr:hypothetical protein LAZ67_20001717 [Cordylochernes scorpioides]